MYTPSTLPFEQLLFQDQTYEGGGGNTRENFFPVLVCKNTLSSWQIRYSGRLSNISNKNKRKFYEISSSKRWKFLLRDCEF